MKRPFASVMLLACIGLVAGTASACSQSNQANELTVSAAASLTGTFTELAEMFESTHPGVSVKLNFGASSALAEQINAGAPVDVFAAASPTTMKTVVEAGNVSDPVTFTENTLAIAVPAKNRANVSSLADLAQPTLTVVQCAKEAPCGVAATKLFEKNGIAVTPASLEPDVKSVLAKVIADEVDAGVVYVTDVLAAGDQVKGVSIPPEQNVITEYQIGATQRNPELADQFIEFIQSQPAANVLTQAGFTQP